MRFRCLPSAHFFLVVGAVCLGSCLYEPAHSVEGDALGQALVAEYAADQTGACNFSESGGRKEIRARATSQGTWTRCDLATGGLVGPAAGWDLAFQRFKIATNSGTSGVGTGGACKTGKTDFDAVHNLSESTGSGAPDCPHFSADQALEGETGGTGGSSVIVYNGSLPLREWFTYSIFGHTLAPKKDVYIIRASDSAKFYKLQFLDYYSAAGTSGYPRFRYQEIPP